MRPQKATNSIGGIGRYLATPQKRAFCFSVREAKKRHVIYNLWGRFRKTGSSQFGPVSRSGVTLLHHAAPGVGSLFSSLFSHNRCWTDTLWSWLSLPLAPASVLPAGRTKMKRRMHACTHREREREREREKERGVKGDNRERKEGEATQRRMPPTHPISSLEAGHIQQKSGSSYSDTAGRSQHNTRPPNPRYVPASPG